MPFLLAILGAVSAFAYYFFIIRRGAEAASEAADLVGTAVGRTKWWWWKKKHLKSPHELIDDPIVSAASLLLALCRLEGELSDKQWAFLRSTLKHTLGLDQDQMDSVLAQARFSIRDVKDVSRFFHKQGQFLHQCLTGEEKADLLVALESAANLENKATQLQSEAINRLMQAFS